MYFIVYEDIDIPTCPITTTPYYLKKIKKRNVLQYNPEEIEIVPKEPILKTKTKKLGKEKEKEPEPKKQVLRGKLVKKPVEEDRKPKVLGKEPEDEKDRKTKTKVVKIKTEKPEEEPEDELYRKTKAKLTKIKKDKPEEEEPEVRTMKILGDGKDKENEVERKMKLIILKRKRNKTIKDLIDDVTRKQLNKYFNVWKQNAPRDDDILDSNIRQKYRKSIYKLRKNKKEQPKEEEKPPQNLNIKIPECPISTTNNPLKGIKKRFVKQYAPVDIESIPTEITLRTKVPERRIYPKIYDEIQKTKRDLDFHLEFLKQVPHDTFNKLMPNKMLDMIKQMHTNLALLKVFYIYKLYKTDKFLIKKTFINRWKKNTSIFNNTDLGDIHITNLNGHCFSMERIEVRVVRCGLHHESMRYYDCLCLRLRKCLKRILLRHYFMKYLDRRRYYLYRWYKNVFRRIRKIYL